ncbi:MAG: hypothetical protein MI743_02550 [Sneathiellales bacterium]|nr:hypothetical protein [Sneathiellales bacterium]
MSQSVVSYRVAYQRLLAAQQKLDELNISVLPLPQQLNLLKSQQALYKEIQALQIRKMTARTDQFRALTKDFVNAKEGFRSIERWAEEAQKAGAVASGLVRGLSLVLSLL